MKHLGNISKINGADIEPVDVITFGSPCQDLSIAGTRAGLHDGKRSNLFFEAIRIIKEMREATDGEYPKFAVWENVPGAFSSNKGHDFHAVLEALCSVADDTVSIPKPYDGKRPDKLVWNSAGEIVGDNFSIAWRVLDAQYWGVPQRRKRIYLVADFTGRRAGEILFKPESLRGDSPKSRETRESASADAVGGADRSAGAISVDISRADYVAAFMGGQGSKAGGIAYDEQTSPTLKAAPSGSNQAPTIVQPIVRKERAGREGGGKGALWSDKAFTLATNQDMSVIALQANGIDRADTAGCNGCGWREDVSYTLNTIDRHAVCFPDVSGTLCASGAGLTRPAGQCNETDMCVVQDTYQSKTGTLMANSHSGSYTGQDAYNDMLIAGHSPKPPRRYIVRRLTPTECARLQGFPDDWGHLAPYNPDDAEFWEQVRKTHAEVMGKSYKPMKDIKKWYENLHTDSAEYKMWGNGIALPCAEYVLRGIAEHGAKTLGSLFDGSGGFPLAGVRNGITPVWASEIEPYPIAVTRSRFGGCA